MTFRHRPDQPERGCVRSGEKACSLCNGVEWKDYLHEASNGGAFVR